VMSMLREQPGRLKVAGDCFGAMVACPETAGKRLQQGIVACHRASHTAK
jgi:hypothetical protein